jgi:thioredoxin-dependent peroxiredoxin
LEASAVHTIEEGSVAPDFELSDDRGNPVRLSKLLTDGPVVLFFYPAASSGGCTSEVCHFRDLKSEFTAAGAQRVGISTDSVSRQRDFATSTSIDFPLVSDESGDVARAYGVKRKYVTPVKRATFVIDTDGTIATVITSELSMTVHADKALESLRELAR